MKPIGEYAKALWSCAVLFVAGAALQFIFGPVKAISNIGLALVLLLEIPVILYPVKDRWKFLKSIFGPENRIITICYLLVLLLFFGLVYQDGSDRGLLGALGFHDMKTSWVFVLPLIYFTILISIQAISDLEIRHWTAIPLFHWGMLFILVAGICGAGERKTAYIQINEGETQGIAIDDSGFPVQLPFSIRLEDFQMQEYEDTHQPKEFLSKIQIISDKGSRQADVRVNHPARSGSWKIYQMDYDVSKGNDSEYSILGVVRDTMWPVTLIGLWTLLIGCILILFERPRKKEAEA
jgi:hypothetical protein